MPEDLQAEFVKAIFEPSALEECGCPDWLRAFAVTFHSHTWFHVRHDDHLTETLQGTRPGDGFADLLFNVVIGRLLRDIEATLCEAGFDISMCWKGLRSLEAADGREVQAAALNIPWADDIAVLVHHETPTGLLESLSLAIASNGLELNFGVGKTETPVLLRGVASRKLRRELFSMPTPTIQVQTQTLGQLEMRLVEKYRHRGFQIHATTGN